MIDINLIREKPEIVRENIQKKFQEDKLELVDSVLELDKEWRKIKSQEDEFRFKRNKISKDISELKKLKKNVDHLLIQAKEIPNKIFEIEEKRKVLEEKIHTLMCLIPNIMHESVPVGRDGSENVEVRKIGKQKIVDYEILNHAELALKLGGADFDSAREISGKGFYFLCGDIALLHSAILSYARDFMVRKGFLYFISPFMIHPNVVEGVMSFKEKEEMMYKIEGEDLYLIGTSEHSMIGRFINCVLNGKKIPLKLTSYSPCFRKEGGSHGIEEKGFFRVHQFEKQEMIVICEPHESYQFFDEMVQISSEFFKSLDLPFRILEICSGDLGDLKAKQVDFEAWSPRQKKYFEVGSCSNLTDSQARRLNIRIDKGGKLFFAHTLNNTVVASPRILISLIENNQTKNGKVKIPKVLIPYMQGKKLVEKV